MRLAVVVYNLGGPHCLDAVRPFLFNLFNDQAIISLPQPLRGLVAALIAWRRAPTAREIYARMGGSSPILAQTRAQAEALKTTLARQLDAEIMCEVFVAMRYWHPMIDEVVGEVKTFGPDRVVLCPLYPQFSTTTTGTFTQAWRRATRRAGLSVPEISICCFPTAAGFVAAHQALILDAAKAVGGFGDQRILFSAHGLPQRIVEQGDPYQWQVEQTVAAVVQGLGVPDLDYRLCYQSRVGPLEWIGPATETEIERAGSDGKGLIVVPIAFVSEHSETLVELDLDYAVLANRAGVRSYRRVPTLGVDRRFIAGLGALVAEAATKTGVVSEAGARLCPADFQSCPQCCSQA